jgi:hypothetical protein
MNKPLTILILFGLAIFLSVNSVNAQTTGKFQGTVYDAQTGEPIPGANVVIDGTRRGSVTDANGYYIILLVDPSTYSMTASLVGYDAQRKTNVLLQSGYTSTVDFSIRETSLELGEMVVIAERPLVEPDKTTSKYMMSAEDMEAVPIVRDMSDFMELQAGVSIDEDGDEILVRGGESKDVSYMIDGIRIVSTDHGGGTRVFRDVNKLAVQELTVISGGYGAEYGNGRGGVVSMVTRDGGSAYHGQVDYQFIPSGQKHWGQSVYDSPMHGGKMEWDNPEWVAQQVEIPEDKDGDGFNDTVQAHRRREYTDKIGHRLEGNLSGPLANNMSFFASTRWFKRATVFPSADLSTPFNTNSSGKLTFSVSPQMKLRVGGLYDNRKSTNGGPSLKNPFLTNDQGMGKEVDVLSYLALTHSLSPKTFYEVRLAYSNSNREETDTRLELSGPRVDAGGFTIHYDQPNWSKFDYNRLLLKVDLSSQINKQNFVKAGIEVTRYNNWFQEFRFDGPNTRYVEWFANKFDTVDFFHGQTNQGLNPIEAGFYISDKIEFEGMIVNAGLRWEIFAQNTDLKQGHLMFPSTMYDGLTRGAWAPDDQFPAVTSFQPRLGISFPITARSLVRFFYGDYRQRPTFENLFHNEHRSRQGKDADLNNDGQISEQEKFNNFHARRVGNPYMVPEETTQFEMGLDWNFVSDYVAAVTAFYKSEFFVTFGEHYWYDVNVSSTSRNGLRAPYSNGRFRDTRGIELSLRKKFSNMFTFNVAYNLQWAEQGRHGTVGWYAYPDSMFVVDGHYFVDWETDPTTGAQTPRSLQDKALAEGRDANFYVEKYGAAWNKTNYNWTAQKENVKPSDEHGTAEIQARSWTEIYALYSADGYSLYRDQEANTSAYDDADKDYWARANAQAGYPGQGEGNLLMRHSSRSSERAPSGIDRRSYGSMMFLFATPSDYGPADGKALGNVRMNLVYRLYTGTRFQFNVGNVEGFRYGPLHTRMDLNLEKVFGSPSGVNVTLAVETYNLFNQQDTRDKKPSLSGGSNTIDFNSEWYQTWGITGLRPTHPDIAARNLAIPELNDISNYWDQPREMNFSVRIKW